MSKEESDLEDESLIDEMYIGEYVGERLDDERRDGFGRAILPNRDQYEGEYRHGMRNGSGCYWYKDRGCYNGEWKKGLKDGHGKFNYPDGSSYCGLWKQGKKHGYGKYVYENGDIYEGSWKENIRHGIGTYTSQESGITFIGTWVDGTPKGPIEICYPNFHYHGYWNKTHPVGKGVFTYGTKYMLPGHIEMFRNPNYNSPKPSNEMLDVKTSLTSKDQGDGDEDDAIADERNVNLTNVEFPKCLPHFIAQEITQYNYSHLPQHPIPPPQSDSDISICTKSSSSDTHEVHLYQMQSPIMVAVDSIQCEGEDGVDIEENEINCSGDDIVDSQGEEGNE